VEIWRSSVTVGANALLVATLPTVPLEGGVYIDQLPLDGVLYWYQFRHNGGAFGAGPFTPWVGGTIPTIIPVGSLTGILNGSSLVADLGVVPAGVLVDAMPPNAKHM